MELDNIPLPFDTTDQGVQTGGAPGAGRVVREASKPTKPKDLKAVVEKLHTSLPLLAAAKLYIYFCEYLLT